MLKSFSPTTRVLMVSFGLGAAGLALLGWTSPVSGTSSSIGLAISFALAFAISESMVFHLEIRRQAHTFSFGEAAIVIGLFLVQPWLLVCSRLVGAGLAMVWRRIPPVKAIFNLSLALAETAVAAAVLAAIAPSGTPYALSIGALLGVAAADLVGVGAVWTAIAIFEGMPRRRQVLGVLEAQMFVTVIAGSVGVVGALAVAEGPWAVGYLVVAAAGTLTVFRKFASLTSKHTGLQTLHDFSRSIADDLDYVRVLQTAMSDLVDVVSATSVMGVALQETNLNPVGIFRMVDGHLTVEAIEGPMDIWDGLGGAEPRLRSSRELHPSVRSQLQIEDGQVITGDLSLRPVDRLVFVATKAATSVGRFDDESVEQVGSMVRYVSATLKNGVMLQEMELASRRDALTGLTNRSQLEHLIDADDGSSAVGIVVISMEDLTDITDSLGHAVGDEVICELAARFKGAADDAVAVARLEGSSFAAFFSGLGSDDLETRAEALVSAVEGDVVTELSRVDVRCVAGVAVVEDPLHGSSDVLRWADLALSEARRLRRTVGVYTRALDDAQQRRLRLSGDLRRAVATDGLELHYQPKMSLDDGRVTAVEALLRWDHPELGPIPADEFIALAETTGSIGEVTAWVLRNAIHQADSWADAGLDVTVAVNLSAMDLLDPGIVERIEGLLESAGLPATMLGLEVTETAIMGDRERAVANLALLRDAGHVIYLDDYGTGQSSLAYLRSLPVDVLKIDGTFIADLGSSERDAVLVTNTIALAHQLGLTVLAEGVEDLLAFDRLRELGCEAGQGYFIARPMSAQDFEAWMERAATLARLLGFDDEIPLIDPSEPEISRPRSSIDGNVGH